MSRPAKGINSGRTHGLPVPGTLRRNSTGCDRYVTVVYRDASASCNCLGIDNAAVSMTRGSTISTMRLCMHKTTSHSSDTDPEDDELIEVGNRPLAPQTELSASWDELLLDEEDDDLTEG